MAQQLFPIYHFKSQTVDKIEDITVTALTNNNRLLIAIGDYNIEVRDLFAEDKKPLYKFSTAAAASAIIHCASGNYVATIERSLRSKNLHVNVVRIYTNWDDPVIIEKCQKYQKVLVGPRIAGAVAPSRIKKDEEYLDMIEISFLNIEKTRFAEQAIFACCQKTGTLLVSSGSSVYVCKQRYVQSREGNGQYRYMDFVVTGQYVVPFIPLYLDICENVVCVYKCDMLYMCRLKRVATDNEELTSITTAEAPHVWIDDLFDPEYSPEQTDILEIIKDGTLNVNNLMTSIVSGHKSKELKSILAANSFPIVEWMDRLNETSSVFKNQYNCFSFEPIKRISSFEKSTIDYPSDEVFERLFTMLSTGKGETIIKILLQVIPSSEYEAKDRECETYCVDGANFKCINLLVVSPFDGFLFQLTSDSLNKEGFEFICAYHFTAKATNAFFESYFLHVLTLEGIETYNVPTFRNAALNLKMTTMEPCYKFISIFGMSPFIDAVDFCTSDTCIALYACDKSGTNECTTVYCLQLPKPLEVYYDLHNEIEATKELGVRRNLYTEAFVILQLVLENNSSNLKKIELDEILKLHQEQAVQLASLYLQNINLNDWKVATAIILVSNVDIKIFVKEMKKACISQKAILFVLAMWLKKNAELLTEEIAEIIIKVYTDSGELARLSRAILSTPQFAKCAGQTSLISLRKHLNNTDEFPDVEFVCVLCVLYSYQLNISEATELLRMVLSLHESYKKSFIDLTLNHWYFLFEKHINHKGTEESFSEFGNVLLENLPNEMGIVLSKLVLEKEIFSLNTMVEMVLKQFPCRVSMEKGQFALLRLLEITFSQDPITCSENTDNCLMMLIRFYVRDIDTPVTTSLCDFNMELSYMKMLPDFVNFLPDLEPTITQVVRKLQGLIWTRKTNVNVVSKLPSYFNDSHSSELKMNIFAMLGDPNYVYDLLEKNMNAVLPYAKCVFGIENSKEEIKKWTELICVVNNKIDESDKGQDYKLLFQKILNYVSVNVSVAELRTIIEPYFSTVDDDYWKYIIRAECIENSRSVKDLIIHTSEQFISSYSF